MHEDGCDNCGKVAELYHNEATGLAFCEDCDASYEAEPESDSGAMHSEIRELIEGLDALTLRYPDTANYHFATALREQAEELLALPEESVAAMVEAARLMVTAVKAA